MKKELTIIVGGMFLITGFIIHFISYSIQNLLIWIVSFAIISIGFFMCLSSIKRTIAYGIMSLINGLSAPIYVCLSILIYNFNYVAMDFFIVSIILGAIGVVIGIVGIFVEIKSIKLIEHRFLFNSLIIFQIILWVVSMVFAMFAPSLICY